MEYDVVVIGSGPGGYVAAIRAAQLGMKVACVDKQKEPGGTCLNVGCIPSKTLLHDSEFSKNFSEMMGRKKKVVKGFNDGILYLFKKNKIDFLVGQAKFLSKDTLQVAGDPVKAKYFIIATGSEPMSLPFLPFDEKRILSSTGALSLEKVPEKMLVIGAGVIGVELGSVYSRLGTKVEFVEFLDRICPTFDESLSKELHKLLTKQGMTFHLSSKVTGAEISKSQITLKVGNEAMTGDVVLVSIGRKPYTQNLGLEAIGIKPDSKGFIPIDGFFRTTVPNIYAIGDVVNGPMLAHKASEEGVIVAEIIHGRTPVLEYMAIPNVIYTKPEVASVGLTEEEAKSFKLSYRVGVFPFKVNSRALCTGEVDGFVKIIGETATDKVLGIHIIGAHASELIAEGVLAIQKKLTCLEIAHTPHAHPTLSEAIKEAALAVHKQSLNQ